MTRPGGFMSDDLFHKIIKEGKEMGVKRYSPFMNGEPFVFPRIWQWLDYMRDAGVKVALYTNGEFVDVDRIVGYENIEYLDFSINATTPETHAKIMRGPKFETVTKNFFEARRKAPFMVRASLVKNEDNINEVEDFKKMFGKVEICDFSNWTGARHSALEVKGNRVPCWVLIHQMFVLWDGRVVPCCMDFDGKQILGDINKQSIKEVWEGSNWMRNKHRNYDFDIPVCKECNYNVIR
jgi:radical SAM protein with 4Fe4S-binding SPASM domain